MRGQRDGFCSRSMRRIPHRAATGSFEAMRDHHDPAVADLDDAGVDRQAELTVAPTNCGGTEYGTRSTSTSGSGAFTTRGSRRAVS